MRRMVALAFSEDGTAAAAADVVLAFDDTTLVHDDYYVRHIGVRDPTDEDALQGVTPISSRDLLGARQALLGQDRSDHPRLQRVRGLVDTLLSRERAKEIRTLRCELRHSWRAVARACFNAWGGMFFDWGSCWHPESNVFFGLCLCERAARMLGEDPHSLPWNSV